MQSTVTLTKHETPSFVHGNSNLAFKNENTNQSHRNTTKKLYLNTVVVYIFSEKYTVLTD